MLALMKKRFARTAAFVLLGLLILAGGIWLGSWTLGNTGEKLYAGRFPSDWQQQLNGRDAGASNAAYAVVNAQVVPQLLDTMFHDTNDSKIKLAGIGVLNGLPGIHIFYAGAHERRCRAAESLGALGPAAKAAVPSLILVLKGTDIGMKASAMEALGKIHSDPDVTIPLLVPYLTNDALNDCAASSLGDYGSLAREVFPKIVPLLKDKDKSVRRAARSALKKIDPEAAAKAGVKK
jgi:HEAT repeat protein